MPNHEALLPEWVQAALSIALARVFRYHDPQFLPRELENVVDSGAIVETTLACNQAFATRPIEKSEDANGRLLRHYHRRDTKKPKTLLDRI
jgi:hypothetical protein